MTREQDVEATTPVTDAKSPLGGVRPDGSSLNSPVSEFTTAAHRVANESQTDERALRQMEAERQHREAQGGVASD